MDRTAAHLVEDPSVASPPPAPIPRPERPTGIIQGTTPPPTAKATHRGPGSVESATAAAALVPAEMRSVSFVDRTVDGFDVMEAEPAARRQRVPRTAVRQPAEIRAQDPTPQVEEPSTPRSEDSYSVVASEESVLSYADRQEL